MKRITMLFILKKVKNLSLSVISAEPAVRIVLEVKIGI